MKRLFRWLRGYVDVRLYGHQVNRFINLCSRNGIHLWNISHDLQHFIRVHFRLRDFYALKPFLRKTKTIVSPKRQKHLLVNNKVADFLNCRRC